MFIKLMKIKKKVFDHLLPTLTQAAFNIKFKSEKFKMFIDTKCLVLSPCPGDETLAMAGFMAKHPKNFEVLSLTDGSKSFPGKGGVDARFARKKEFNAAMDLLRVKGHKIFDIEEGTLFENYHKFSKTDISEIDYIFIPSPFEQNADSKAILLHLIKLLKEKEHKETLKIVFYEGYNPLSLPNCCVDTASTIGVKQELLSLYPSRGNNNIFSKGIISLNAYRGAGIQAEYAESFLVMELESFTSMMATLDLEGCIKNLSDNF